MGLAPQQLRLREVEGDRVPGIGLQQQDHLTAWAAPAVGGPVEMPGAGHLQVGAQRPPVVQPDHQVLAASVHTLDHRALEPAGRDLGRS